MFKNKYRYIFLHIPLCTISPEFNAVGVAFAHVERSERYNNLCAQCTATAYPVDNFNSELFKFS